MFTAELADDAVTKAVKDDGGRREGGAGDGGCRRGGAPGNVRRQRMVMRGTGSWRWVGWVAALTLVGMLEAGGALAGPDSDAAAEPRSSPAAVAPAPAEYLRIRVSPDQCVYVEFREDCLRAATTVKGLDGAQSVAPSTSSRRHLEFPAVEMPVLSSGAPAGSVKLKASFLLMRAPKSPDGAGQGSYVYAGLSLSRKDESGTLWTYSCGVSSPTAAAAEDAPLIEAADPGKLNLTVVALPERGVINVGLRLAARGAGKCEIRKNGEPVAAKLRVVDGKGVEVASDSGPLQKFGFT